MSMEIELKAWVDDPRQVAQHLKEIYGEGKDISKEDIYYQTSGRFPQLNTIRLRRSNGSWILTYKDKRLDKGLEINREHETQVENFEVMDELLKRFGCTYYLKKHKEGSLFQGQGLVIELVKVEGLGTFLEIEKIVPEGEADIEAARAQILDVFRSVGIDPEKIEGRYYSDMLLDR